MPRKLIICADGTWNAENNTDEGRPAPTNVLKIARALRPETRGGISQIIHYQSGVGTDLSRRFIGGAFGAGLFENVIDCYRFLVHNYQPGDELYLFGFSRGAYTARSLAGLIRNSGILKRGHEGGEQTAIALYRDYTEDTLPEGEKSIAFRAAHSHETDIHFIGVWDTVGALGIPGFNGSFRLAKGLDWQFHDVTLSQRVHFAYHALAVHEHRAEFVPTLWEIQPPDPAHPQTLEQVWFSGAHSDVGGGYAATGLSDVALSWMVEKAIDAGLEVDLEVLPGYKPDPLAEGHDSFSALYKILGVFRGKPTGEFRTYDAEAKSTCQTIHPGIRKRFEKEPDKKKWPPTFFNALGKKIEGVEQTEAATRRDILG
jgi:Uncharacterized alpha/beta hydrolase domain (DUF2235)